MRPDAPSIHTKGAWDAADACWGLINDGGMVRRTHPTLASIQNIQAIEREDDRHAYIKIQYQNGIVVPSSGLSDGTLSILALTILPYVGKRPQVITLEEPENGIHTELEKVLCMCLTDEGSVSVVSGDKHPRWQGGIDLGTLFAAGVLS